jgi:hypothetical protein
VLPPREPFAKPRRAPAQTLRAYARAIERVRRAPVRWSEFAVGFWCSGKLASKGAAVSVHLDVSAVAVDGPTERGITVLALVYSSDAERPLTASMTRAVRTYLERAGYERSRRPRKGDTGPSHVGGWKTVKSPVAAARECAALSADIAGCVSAAPAAGKTKK